jgi:2-dehydropantoate 2-reductase
MTTHAVLGAGGVGGFVATLLAGAGHDVTLLLRAERLADHPRELELESPFGRFRAPVGLAARLDEPVDVLWVTVKATQLDAAMPAVPEPELAGVVVPLLNGIDHVPYLRSRWGDARVVAASIGIEAERVAPGRIVHRSPFARLSFPAAEEPRLGDVAATFTRYGCTCRFDGDETSVLWRKLVFLAPFALSTSAAGASIGEVREQAERRELLERAVGEACAVAQAAGAEVDEGATLRGIAAMPGEMRSSMQKDLAAGNPLELDAIAGPILRGAERHGIRTPAVSRLAAEVERRSLENAR